MPVPQRMKEGEEWWPSTAAHNAFVDAWQYTQHLKHSGGAGTGRGGFNGNVIEVRNDSESDRGRFDILGLGDPLISADDNLPHWQTRIALSGVEPAKTHRGNFAVLLQPLKAAAGGLDGQIGLAAVGGLVQCRVDFSLVNRAGFAGIKPEDPTCLQAANWGSARLVSPTTGSGVEWAVVRLGDHETRLPGFKLADDHPGAPDVEFRVWLGVWDWTAKKWTYEETDANRVWCTDGRRGPGIPYPEACATGLGKWRPDAARGHIIEVVSLDCESEGCASYYSYGST